MSQTVYPGERLVTGIFMLGKTDLLELDEIIRKTKPELKSIANQQLRRHVDEMMRDRNLTTQEDRTKLRQTLKERYPHDVKECEVIVRCRSGTAIKAKTFADIMANSQLSRESPRNSTVSVRIGNVGLTVKLLTSYDRDSIDVSLTPNNASTQRIGATIRDWAESKRRVDWWRKWAFILGCVGAALLMIAFIVLPFGAFAELSNRPAATTQAQQLLAEGITENEQTEALELILKFESQSFTQNIIFDLKSWYVGLLLLGIGLVAFGLLRPRSTLGIGQSQRTLTRYLWVIWIIKGVIAIWLTGVATSVIASYVYTAISYTPSNK